MKNTIVVLAAFVALLHVSCKNETPATEFKLMICYDTTSPGTRFQYILSDDSIVMQYLKDDLIPFDTIMYSAALKDMDTYNSKMLDTLELISKLDKKTYDCKEQHALVECYVLFFQNGKTENVDPNINHPKELDYAVRMINSLVPEKYKLEFIDMQPAIEPNGQMRL